jgi:inorganic pyrophosphatase
MENPDSSATAGKPLASSTTGVAALSTFDEDGHLLAVVEACRGSANKLKFDPRRNVFVLHNVLPLGATFPYEFGFVPGTLGDDGDPLDVLILMDEAVAAGVVVPCRLLGVIEASQRKTKDTRSARWTRNDRLVGVAAKSHRHEGVRSLRDVTPRVLEEIERFFVFYNEQKGVRFEPAGRKGVAVARQLVAAGRRAFERERKR